jgi:uncharacterized protein (TIGR02996 family)
MNDHDALLHAIGEHPEEDTPRLMYADWLEENGEPERADFVRVQVELGRLDLNDPARRPWVLKNVAYLRDFVPHWKALLPQLDGIEWGDFNRGLIEEVQALRTDTQADVQEARVVQHAATIFAVPGIHILRTRLQSGAALAQVPELVRLRALRIVAGRATANTLRTLFASPYLSRLTTLDLHGNHADDAVAADLADGRFPDLAELWLGNNRVGVPGALALANSPHLTKLRLLDLRGNMLTDPTAQTALRRRFGSALKV